MQERAEKCKDFKVFIRLFPCSPIYNEHFKFNLKTNTIYLRCKDSISHRDGRRGKPPQYYWNFFPNKVFLSESPKVIFDEVTKGILDKSICNKTDAVIMAYGQVGSGKTYTMTGLRDKYFQRGVVPRFIAHVVQYSKRSDIRVNCDISFIEIIGQNATDLFTGKYLHMEDMRRVPTITLTSKHSGLVALYKADSRRKLADSGHFGNRGHAIVTFYLRTLDLLLSNAEYQLVKIHFVDLAGVDSCGHTEYSGKASWDIGKSNITKSFLDQCFHHLEKPRMLFVRDLAVRFLGDSLSEESTLRFIGHVKMTEPDMPISLSLLRFSSLVAGKKVDKKTLDPSLLRSNKLESLESLRAKMQLDAMLRNCSDYLGSGKSVCHERMAMMRSKAHEYFERDLEEDVLAKKTEESFAPNDNPDLAAESLGYYPPIPTDFDFKNDPLFNYHNCTPDEFALQYGSRTKLRSKNDKPAHLESQLTTHSRSNNASRSHGGSRLPTDSRQHVESRLRFGSVDPPPPAQDNQYKTDSPLQTLISLKIAKEIASQIDADSKPLKAEAWNLFENKLDREKRTSEFHIAPLSISKRSTVIKKRMSLEGPVTQGNVRKASSKKNIRSALSASGVTSRSQSKHLITPVVRQEKAVLPPPREIDDQGVTIGPAALYPFQGRIAVLTKCARVAEVKRHGMGNTRVEAEAICANEKRDPLTGHKKHAKAAEAKRHRLAKLSNVIKTANFKDRAPWPLEELERIKEEAAAKKLLHNVLDEAIQEAARSKTKCFEATRKLEWCRYQWARANNDLQEVHESRSFTGAEQNRNNESVTTIGRESRLSEFIREKRQEFHNIQQELLSRRDALNNAMIRVDQAQKNLDAAANKTVVERPEGTSKTIIQRLEATSKTRVQHPESTSKTDVHGTEATSKTHVHLSDATSKTRVQRAEATSKTHIQRVEATSKTRIQRAEATSKTNIQRAEATSKTNIQRVEATSKTLVPLESTSRIDAQHPLGSCIIIQPSEATSTTLVQCPEVTSKNSSQCTSELIVKEEKPPPTPEEIQIMLTEQHKKVLEIIEKCCFDVILREL